MEFRILGPLQVQEGERSVECRGAKQRLVLAMLLLHANEPVSTDRLIDVLWGETPPATAPKALQMHVSELRKTLGRDAIATRPPGYELRVEPDALDLWRFERAVGDARTALDAGRAAEAAHGLRDALELWRGPALADLSFEEALQADIARLEELRVVVLEERIDADLELGRHAELVPELESLIAAHPLRERPHGQLIVALYRCGRQADALEAYRGIRRSLVEELGIEPGRRLRDLEAAVLAQDEALDAPSRAAGARPIERPQLFGRERELASVVPAVERLAEGRPGGVVLIGGEPGIGKSRLAHAFAAEAEARGVRVLVGRCWEAGDAPPYWPWAQALRSHLPGTDLQTLAPGTAASHSARFQLFEATAGLLRGVADDGPLAVFLDDVHAADASSLLLLRFVGSTLEDAPVLLVACYRSTEIGPELEETLVDLGRHTAVTQVTLEGVDRSGTEQLLEDTIGRAPSPDLVDRVQARTGGNPLFVSEVGRLLASGGWDEDTVAGRGFPVTEGLRAAITSRLQDQPQDCRELLAMASVVGREFDLALLARVADLEDSAVLSALEYAHAARILEPAPGGRGRMRFSHVLVRDALYDDLSPARRQELHRGVAAAIEGLYAHALGPYLSELAAHYGEAGSRFVPDALDYAVRAGDHAVEQLGYEQAARHYEDALELMEAVPTADPSPACEVMLSLGDVLSRAGDDPAAKAAFRRAASAADETGDAARLARAALGYGGRFAWARAGTDPELVPLCERALAAVGKGDSADRARLLSRLAGALRDEPSREHRVALANEAVEIARRIGDPRVLAYTLAANWPGVNGPDTTETRVSGDNELLALAERLGDTELAYLAHAYRLHTLWALTDRAGVDVALDAQGQIADALGQPAQRWDDAAMRTALALMEGRFDDAERLMSEALEHGRLAQSWNARLTHLLASFVLCRAQGRLADMEGALERAVHEYPTLLRVRSALAHLHAELGRERETRHALDELLGRDLTEPFDEEWLVGIGLLVDPCAYLRDEAAAATLYDLLAPYCDFYAVAPSEVTFGTVARGLGVLATTMRRFDDAEAHFERALEIEQRLHAPPWLAHTQHDFARMLLARGGEGDESRARELAADAAKTYRQLGMDGWCDRLTAEAAIRQSKK